ncbi:MAG: YicC family protein [Spirochaetes bacterium]|nr:YicC family protein [Spirochaetota bacterium]
MDSMTGYAYIEKSNHQFSFAVEVKSLNSKFLEIIVNLPKILRKNESDLIQILKDKFPRGKIVLTIDIYDWAEDKKVSINKNFINNIYSELKKVERELGADNLVTGDVLFSFDNVINYHRTLLTNQSYNEVLKVLYSAIDVAKKMQRKEGNIVKKDLEKSLSFIGNSVVEIKKKYKDISKVIFNKLKKNIESITKFTVNDNRLYSEVAILADKLDINEEIVRLNNHLKKFKSLMNEKGQIGKRLDFLAQEMFRETNTISSKANSSEISHIVVEIKNNIDKIREHSRNII